MNGNDRAITRLTMLGHGMFHTYEMSIPVFVAVWLQTFGASRATLGLTVGAGLALVGVFAPLTGLLADEFGSKRLVMLAIFGMGAGFLLLSPAPSILLVAAAIVLWGLAASLYHPAGLSLISRGVERRGTALGYHGAAGSAGTAIGPLTVLVLLVFLDWRAVAALLFVPALVAVLIGWRIEFEPGGAVDDAADAGAESAETDGGRAADAGADSPDDGGGAQSDAGETFETDVRSVGEFLSNSRLLFSGGFVLVFLIHIGYGMYFRGVFTFLPDLLAGLALFDTISIAGRPVNPGRYVYSALLLVGVAGQYAGGKLSDWERPEKPLVVLLAALVVVTLLFVPATTAGVGPLLAVSVALGLALFLAAPITLTLVAEYAAPEVHGLSYGFTYLGLFGFGSLGATGAGVVLTYADMGTLFTLLAVVAAALTVVTTVLLKRY